MLTPNAVELHLQTYGMDKHPGIVSKQFSVLAVLYENSTQRSNFVGSVIAGINGWIPLNMVNPT